MAGFFVVYQQVIHIFFRVSVQKKFKKRSCNRMTIELFYVHL